MFRVSFESKKQNNNKFNKVSNTINNYYFMQMSQIMTYTKTLAVKLNCRSNNISDEKFQNVTMLVIFHTIIQNI